MHSAVTCDTNSQLIVWDLAKQAAVAMHDVSDHGGVHSIAISLDSKIALVTGEKGLMTKWDLDTGQSTGKLELKDEHFHEVAFAPDPKIAAVMHSDTLLSFLDVDNMKIFDCA